MARPVLNRLMKSIRLSRGSGKVRSLARLVLSYLRQQPDAEDKLEGITQWWILKQRICESEQDVQEALDLLLRRRRIVARRQVDGRVYYRLNRTPAVRLRR